MYTAGEEDDKAHETAKRAQVATRMSPRAIAARVLKAEEEFVDGMMKQAGIETGNIRNASIEERVEKLPGPWKSRTEKEIDNLRERIEDSLGGT